MNALITLFVLFAIILVAIPVVLPVAYLVYRIGGGKMRFWKFVWSL